MTTITIPPGSILDPYLKANRTNTRFVLGPGDYMIGTGWAFDKDHDHCCLGPDCELIGAGSQETRVMSPDPETVAPEGAKQVEVLTAGSRSALCDSAVIRGLTLSASDGECTKLGIVGIHTWANRSVIEDVAVHGIRGFRPDREGFGVLVNGAGNGWARGGGSRVENVEVTADGYVCGVYIGYPDPDETSIARNIRVSCNEGAHAAFGTNGGVLWSGLSSTGPWQRAVFCDTKGGNGTVISGSHLQATNVLVEFRGGTGVRWDDIIVTDSILEVADSESRTARDYSAALVLARDGEPPGPEFNGVVIQNCTIRGCGLGDHYVGSIDSGGKGNGVFYCRLVGATWKPPVLAGGFNGMREFGTVRL